LAKRDFAQNNKLAFKKEIAHPTDMALKMLLFCRSINERAMGKRPRRVIPTGLLSKKNRQSWRTKFWLTYGKFLVFMKMQASVIASI